jgi:hypothetical protein
MKNIKITLSNHAIQQGYKRLQVNSDELLIISNNSILEGIPKEKVRTFLRNKIKRVVNNTIENGCLSPFVRVYDKKIFIFEHCSSSKYKEYKLITFFEIEMPDSLYYSMIK